MRVFSALQLHQFELAVGQTDCVVGAVTQEAGSTASSTTPGQPSLLQESGTAAATTTGTAGAQAEAPGTMHFEVPAYVQGGEEWRIYGVALRVVLDTALRRTCWQLLCFFNVCVYLAASVPRRPVLLKPGQPLQPQ